MTELSRRRIIVGGLAAFAGALIAACTRRTRDEAAAVPSPTERAGGATTLSPTPACPDAGGEPTPEQTEGPYFTPRSPEKSDLAADVDSGRTLVLTGSVLTTSCTPVVRALLDFWQADAEGNYDNDGYRLRGHLFTDDDGRYKVRTIVPGLYPGRTRHIHVKVQPPNGSVLTTQLYFPGEPQNDRDGIFREELLLDLRDDGRTGSFTFVVDT